jgi:PadR family transcriptional regulator AphA
MSLQHAILGFLSYEPLSGYGLKKAFDRSVQHFWPANQSQIYSTLARMKEDGLVNQEVIEREDRLDKKVYHITEDGLEELHRWLATPLPHKVFREPFLIQIYFGSRLSNREFEDLVQVEIQAAKQVLALYKSIYQPYLEEVESRDDPRALFMSLLTLEYGILSNQLILEWLTSVVERVDSENYTLREFS